LRRIKLVPILAPALALAAIETTMPFHSRSPAVP
jgi:hypothetical protein